MGDVTGEVPTGDARASIDGASGASVTPSRVDATAAREGRLELRFEAGRRGTWLASQAAVAPLRAHRAFAAADGDAVVQVVHVGPGLLAGDVVTLDVHVAAGASAIVVPQSATKIHTMREGERALQRIRVRVDEGGSLEMHGALAIPFPGSAFEQTAEIDLAPGATLLWTERWTTGRDLPNEHGRFRQLSSRLALRAGGVLRYADRMELFGTAHAGDDPRAGSLGVLDGYACLATGVAMGEGAHALNDARELHDAHGLAVGRFDDDGVYLRALTDDACALGQAVYATAASLRAARGRGPVAYGRYGA